MLAFAIDTFRRIERAERRLEKLRAELESYLVQLPDEDRAAYAAATRSDDDAT